MQVRQRHFRGRNQVQVPVARDLEQVLLELRQVAGAAQRLGVDEKRRLDLEVAVLARVQVEHEVDQRAREPRAGARSAPRSARRTSSSRARSRGCRAPDRDPSAAAARSRTRAARRARRTSCVVCRRSCPTGTLACGRFGHRHQQRRALLLDLIELDLELLDLLRRAPCSRRRSARRPAPAASRARPRRRRCSARASALRSRESGAGGASRASRAAPARRPARGRGSAGRRGRRRCDRARTPASSIG